ncbi:hypothetical protein ACFS07_16565 [Undibacterium arcticum]
MVEALMVMSPQAQPQRTGANQDAPIRLARFCYDHLAGRLGTGLTAILLERGLLSIDGKAFAVTAAGESWFQSFGIDLGSLRSGRRQFAHQCLDWTERKDHLAGALGAAIAQRLLELGWITRQKNPRAWCRSPSRASMDCSNNSDYRCGPRPEFTPWPRSADCIRRD